MATFAALSAVVLILFGASPARAVDFVTITPVDDGNPLTNDLGRANSDINTVSFKRNALQTVGQYQFTSYYHADGRAVIGRRKLGSSQWDLFKTQFTSFNIDDAHNVTSIAIDGNGAMHMSWGLHGDTLLYTKSTGSVLNDGPINLIGATVGNSAAPNSMSGLYNTAVTYPEFYSLPDGDLLFTYRNGSSGNGDYRLRRYDTVTQTWTEQGPAAFSHIWLGRQAPGSTLPNVNAYPNQLAFDSQGNIHATWTWRTGDDTTKGQAGFQTNHNLLYARSADEGRTWTKMDGTAYTLPIYETNAQIAVNLPEGSSIINTTGMAVDKLDQPVVASWWAPLAPQGNHSRQYMFAWYDKAQGQWRTSQITNRTVDGNPTSPLPESRVRDLGRPIVVVDNDNRAIVVYRDNQGTNGLTAAFSKSSERNDWQFLELSTENLGALEPTYDPVRWQRDGVLSIFYQPTGLSTTSSPVSVLEWDVRSYFANEGLPRLKLVVDRGTGEMVVTNSSGQPIAFDGYTTRSPSGSLNPSGWNSLHDQLGGGWTELPPSATQLNELNPTGSLTLNNGQSVSLSAAFKPAYTQFGQTPLQDVSFEFTRAGGPTGIATVEYTGVSRNNLTLIVDPQTGIATLNNTSPFNVSIDAYTIASATGSLSTTGWNSLHDQGTEGNSWVESNVNTSRLSELNPVQSKSLLAGDSLALGQLFKLGGQTDLQFSFAISGGTPMMNGIVLYVAPGLPGDYNDDGTVNAADYVVWRDSVQRLVAPGTAADGNGNGMIDAGDYAVWRAYFGQSAGSGTSAANNAVPEATSLALVLLGTLALISVPRSAMFAS